MTIKVFIAEKPSVAKAIINELGTVKKLNGAVLCKNNIYVTWCFGHLLEQAEPDAYLPEDIPVGKKGNKIWRVQDLPIFPQKWILQPKKDKGVKAQQRPFDKSRYRSQCGRPGQGRSAFGRRNPRAFQI